MEALCDDEVLAEQILDNPTREEPPRRRMSEYGAEVELLSLLADRLAELIGTVAASRGVQPRKIPPAPRPVTAADRVRKRRRQVQHRSLVSRLLPHKQDQPATAVQPPQPPQPAPVKPEPRSRRAGWADTR